MQESVIFVQAEHQTLMRATRDGDNLERAAMGREIPEWSDRVAELVALAVHLGQEGLTFEFDYPNHRIVGIDQAELAAAEAWCNR